MNIHKVWAICPRCRAKHFTKVAYHDHQLNWTGPKSVTPRIQCKRCKDLLRARSKIEGGSKLEVNTDDKRRRRGITPAEWREFRLEMSKLEATLKRARRRLATKNVRGVSQ